MAIDHSLTYKEKGIRNIFHKWRLSTILKIIDSVEEKNSFCDVGCSNGYLTNLIAERWCISNATGLDHSEENINIAKK